MEKEITIIENRRKNKFAKMEKLFDIIGMI